MSMEPNPPSERTVRLNKLHQLSQMGIDSYTARAKSDMTLESLLEKFVEFVKSKKTITVCGRVISKRLHGKSAFAHIKDGSASFQIYAKLDLIGEDKYNLFKKMIDVGDFLQITGTLFRTRTEEETILVEDLKLLSKALLPLPEKWHGLVDEDKRIRYRYLDMLMDSEVKERFIIRSKITSTIRNYLDSLGYIEVETPILQRLYGGAFAKPFETHHNAMDMKLYLRIATELYLKRVIIGGIDKVYEIGKDFRNEGIDRMHNPEFTMIEIYQAFADYNDMMDLTENLVKYIADKTTGTLKIDYQGTTTELTKPFARISFWEIIEQRTGRNLRNASRDQLIAYLDEQHIEFDPKASDYVLVDEIFKERVERTLIEPTFIIDYPLELSPLAKRKSGTKSIVERFEFFWYGFEIANAFTELNDPIDQRARFEEQMKLRAKGNLEAQVMDEDFLTAIEHGMPPTAGMGMGIDRIVMILTNSYSLKDVILFPLQRPLK